MINLKQHQWVHIGNINKVKKIVMDAQEFNLARIEALEKRLHSYSELIDKFTEKLAYNVSDSETLNELKTLIEDSKCNKK
tara:strand:+ start:1007 stop:1246 length:240 start_codon:yes stop_codon:yes gene_type:complete